MRVLERIGNRMIPYNMLIIYTIGTAPNTNQYQVMNDRLLVIKESRDVEDKSLALYPGILSLISCSTSCRMNL